MEAMNMPQASIVICTHNPSPLLEDVLRALAGQEGIGTADVLVIDNASTPQVSIPQDLSTSVRVIVEKKLGLSHARNRGIEEAQSDLVLFLDDDAVPEAGWLAAMTRAAAAYPAAAAFGGHVAPVFALPLPAWIDSRHLPYFGAFDHGPACVRLGYPHFPRGCNMMLRRSMLPEAAAFSALFGKRGRKQSCYEEIDLCWRLDQRGLHSMYVPEARVRHFMGTERIDRRWFAARVFEQGKAVRIFERRHRIPPARRMLRRPWRTAGAGTMLEARLARGYLWGSILPLGKTARDG